MSNPAFTVADFAQAIEDLLPTGRAWPKEQGTLQDDVAQGLAPSAYRLALAGSLLLVDAFPATTVHLLPEWEESLGLPDPCLGELPTIQQRQVQVVARFASGGGQSVPYLEAYAAMLGFTVTVVPGTASSYTLTINSALNAVTYFRAGVDTAGEPLASWGNTVLECEIKRIAPAEATLVFAYH